MLNNRNKTSERAAVLPVGQTIMGGLAGLLLTGLLTFLSAVLLHKELLPVSACNWLGLVIIALSALCSAWLTARHNAKKLLCGLLSSGLYGLGLVICGMLLFSSPMQSGRMLLSAGALLVGLLGGVVLSALGE